MSYRKIIVPISLVAATLILAGCHGKMHEMQMMQMDEMRSSIDEAMRTANMADHNATQAKEMADEAMSMMHKMMMKKGTSMRHMMK